MSTEVNYSITGLILVLLWLVGWCSVVQSVPGMRGCPVSPIGGIPKLFMAVAQALGSDIGIVMELESMVILQIPSVERQKRRKLQFSETS